MIKNFVLRGVLAGAIISGSTHCADNTTAATAREYYPIITTNRAITAQVRRAITIPATGVRVSTEFDGARLNDFRQAGPAEYEAFIAPENAPINDSAWYAFKISSPSNQSVSVKLTYTDGRHRYPPKVSRDGQKWTALPLSSWSADRESNSALLKLQIGPEPLWVAGQELFTAKDFERWTDEMSRHSFVRKSILGRSAQGRPIPKLEITEAADDADAVVIISRQHPPEVTGTFAVLSFVETICGDSPAARAFRKQYKVVVVPMVNPDGVDGGHWRHNTGGVDLNRDWGQFHQPETRLVRDELIRVKESSGKVRFALDFHSTRYDVFYPVLSEPAARAASTNALKIDSDDNDALLVRWLGAIRAQFPDYKVNVDPSLRQPGRPTLVSAQWMDRNLGAPAVTYEVGDETNRELIRRVGQGSAEAMMKLLLEQDRKTDQRSRTAQLELDSSTVK